MDNQSPHSLLRVPTPNQQKLSFAGTSVRDIKLWLSELPKANIGETARQLYQALIELNQLVLPGEPRLQLVELLRADIYFVCQHLEKHFLGRSVVLDERPRKVANLCQALQNHLAIAYKLVVVDTVNHYTRERAQLLATATERAMRSLYAPLVRASQLYCPMPDGLWLELHQLYRLAAQYQIEQLPVADEQSRYRRELSIAQAYKCALLLGCARTNQMRQNGIAQLSDALELWSERVRLTPVDRAETQFAVAPQVDAAPRYKALFGEGERPYLLGLDASVLVEAIHGYLQLPPEQRANANLEVPPSISPDLLQHLNSAWGDIAERSFQRLPGQGSLTLCLGMSALHYFLAGRRSFSDVLRYPEQIQAASFSAGGDDVWASAFDAQKSEDNVLAYEEISYSSTPAPEEAHELPDEDDSYPTHSLRIVNHSPGGYCLSWPREVPPQLQAGELLGLQDNSEEGHHNTAHSWSIAVVRWIRQVRGGGTQMGLELISPQAQPCGLRLLRKTDHGSQYLRALLLPAIAAIGRPASLLTPRLPFQEGNKVLINLNGEEYHAVLNQRLTSTGSFSQFEYQRLDVALEDPVKMDALQVPVTSEATAEEDFDSLWKSL